MNSKNIIVVGGGSAGWLTALAAKKAHPDLNITVIESKDIGILGAGEGSTPQLLSFLQSLDITIADLIKNCDATVKNGIKFTNWNNDNKFYYHAFEPTLHSDISITAGMQMYTASSPLIVKSILLGNDRNAVDFNEKISENSKIPFISQTEKDQRLNINYKQLYPIAVHFNAIKLANYLKDVGVSRGINVINQTVINVSLDSFGNVSSLILENNEKLLCDFVFDCSGFHRLIIGKTFNSEWKDYKDYLPVNSAVPFFIDIEEKIPPYTEAIAMKYGWMWKIPLQSRFGCGYVFDSSLISEKDAMLEIEEFLGYVPEYPRKEKGAFKFNAGCYERSWINNCISVGLSASFIEPLEATSLWVTVLSLNKIFSSPDWIISDSEAVRNDFNKFVKSINESIVDFIFLHYMGSRNDTEFWHKFSYKKASKKLQDMIDLWQSRLPNRYDFDNFWHFTSFWSMAHGINRVSANFAKQYIESSISYQESCKQYDKYMSHQNNQMLQCVDHREFIESIK